MSHPENVSIHEALISQIEELYRQSFIMAEKLISESMERIGLQETDRKEMVIAALPMIALELRNQMSAIAQMAEQAGQVHIDRMYEAVQKVVDEMKRRSSGASKK
jgi:hypothetical protein